MYRPRGPPRRSAGFSEEGEGMGSPRGRSRRFYQRRAARSGCASTHTSSATTSSADSSPGGSRSPPSETSQVTRTSRRRTSMPTAPPTCCGTPWGNWKTDVIAFKQFASLDEWPALHPRLRDVLGWLSTRWPDAYMEVTRILTPTVDGESGMHRRIPHRAADLRTNDLPE